jgi:uncharacterized protein YbjT (DUF2867 family)
MAQTKVLIIGASGQIAEHVVRFLKDDKSIELTLFLRNKNKLKGLDTAGMKIAEGDAMNVNQLEAAIKGQDIIYVNLAGNMDVFAKNIIKAMNDEGVKRMIFVSSMGVYDEVPGKFGKWNKEMIGADLKPYTKATEIIEKSDLDYTIIRPNWLTDYDEVAYETSRKGEFIKGTEVSRKSVADLITKLIQNPALEIRESLGINKPGTDGDKPAFY